MAPVTMSTMEDPNPGAGSAPLVTVGDLTVKFVSRDRTVHAVNGIGFSLRKGEVLSIIAESGSGKSVTLRELMRLLPSRAQIGGRIVLDGCAVLRLKERQLADIRGPAVSIVLPAPGVPVELAYSLRE